MISWGHSEEVITCQLWTVDESRRCVAVVKLLCRQEVFWKNKRVEKFGRNNKFYFWRSKENIFWRTRSFLIFKQLFIIHACLWKQYPTSLRPSFHKMKFNHSLSLARTALPRWEIGSNRTRWTEFDLLWEAIGKNVVRKNKLGRTKQK